MLQTSCSSTSWFTPVWGCVFAVGLWMGAASAYAGSSPQDDLPIILNAGEQVLEYDWPMIRVGTAEYPDGPTGVTVLYFDEKVSVAIDSRGGGPGTVNADYMNIGYDFPELDTMVFSGGSWYGLETVTAVASALKDDGIHDGDAFGAEPNIAMSVGSIIFDFGPRRLNEIYPDKRLAQAAFRAAQPGKFPLGAQGAGRFTKSGAAFGCHAFSGQGGAFKQIGDLKIAAFVVMNPYGVVTDRDGTVQACYRGASWPKGPLRGTDLTTAFPASRDDDWEGPKNANSKNTTVGVVIVNQKLEPALLKRLAVQVQTSMARSIQPFATIYDGDVIYAVSTNELEEDVMDSMSLGIVASEVMWDAILSSVPDQPVAATPSDTPFLSADALADLEGDYTFSAFVTVQIEAEGDTLYAQATGKRDAYSIEREGRTALLPVSETDFMVPGRYPLTIRFETPGEVIFNPGHWQQVGTRSAPVQE